MSKYVDGYVIPVLSDQIEVYRTVAEKASKIWREHGALDYRECVLEDGRAEKMVTFSALADTKPGETVVFAYITYLSRAHRDEVNAKVMADPRIHELGGAAEMPFECHRMAYGGFQTLVGD